MGRSNPTTLTDTTASSGFGVVDEKGRLTLTKSVRNALGIDPGSQVAFVLLDGALLIVPQDDHLAVLMQKAAEALARTGLTAQDFLDELPAAGDAVFREAYGDEFVQKIERLRAELGLSRSEG